MKLYMADLNTEDISSEDFYVKIDGIKTEVKAGATLRLRPGQSITIYPYLYHEFWAEEATCLVGEVSKVNDDNEDNRFHEQTERFSNITEDEKPYRLLCNEYNFNTR